MSETVREIRLKDADYPEPLRGIRNPPPLLYVRGTLPIRWDAFAVVGTRVASPDALLLTTRIVRQLAKSAETIIVSGLAIGIDTAAHRAALKSELRTAAVLGNGLNRIYPEANRALAEMIVAAGGCLISEQPPDAPPLPRNLIARDRIQAGLSLAVLLMQSEIDGGAMYTAAFALHQGKGVFAVPPGSRSSKWSGNRLLLAKRPYLRSDIPPNLRKYASIGQAIGRPLNSTSVRALLEMACDSNRGPAQPKLPG